MEVVEPVATAPRSKYPFYLLEKGKSFFVPVVAPPTEVQEKITKLHSSIAGLAGRCAKATKRKFTVRRITHNHQRGIEVTRIE